MKILVVDDDVQVADLVAFTLQRDGFLVRQVHNGLAGLRAWEAEKPDLVVLDVNMPGMDGFEVCRRIRAQSATPILMLSGNGHERDIKRGLALGANDYLTKPFIPSTLLGRVRALLDCAELTSSANCSLSEFTLDPLRHALRTRSGATIDLTPKEYRVLHYLIVNQGRTLSAEKIIDHVWGYHDRGARALLKQLVRRLRTKIEPDPAQPRYLQTVRGIGYKLSVPFSSHVS